MIQKMKIRNALKLIDKMEQLEDLLWQRYYNEFLELLATEDLIEPSNNIKGTNTSSQH
jgi:hypothetical protein